MAVTTQQVKVYMSSRKSGSTQVTAAARAGFSERTARRIDHAEHCHGRERHWRTRPDPFEAVWESELLVQLQAHPHLSAVVLLEALQERYPGQYPDRLLRTLQRRLKQWRALHGPDKEVMFRQEHPPGQLGLSDFTTLSRVQISLDGVPFKHLLYHFRLAASGWCHVKVIRGGESYTALAEGLQQALHRLGGAPAEHRTDSLSAAYRNLTPGQAEDITDRYGALCRHYGMTPSRNNPGLSHENGAIESPHGHLKRRLEQALALRGSCDFPSLRDYQEFIDIQTAKINRRNQLAIDEERDHLQPLPATRAADHTELFVRVTTASTISVRLVIYSVPARLIGERLRVHLYDDRLECFLGSTRTLLLERIYPAPGKRRARAIDYHHLIEPLARKPMAFYHSQLRGDILPNDQWRGLWRQIDARLDARAASHLMVTALKLAARHDCQAPIADYLQQRLDTAQPPTPDELLQRFAPSPAVAPAVRVQQHEVAAYDQLLPLHLATTSTQEPCHD